MSKPVCCKGDVQPTADSNPISGDSSGSWTVGPAGVSYKTYAHLTVGGKEVVHEASCDFNYSGVKGNSSYTDSETVTLTAKTTVLEHGSSNVLLNAESAQGTKGTGNKLEVQSSRVVKSD
jgi:hypothetical protein